MRTFAASAIAFLYTSARFSANMHDAFFALFCTIDQPASYINGLLQHAEKHSFDAGNIFSLIESPDQKHVNKPTGPEQISDFRTGFEGWSIEQLGEFCKEKFDWRTNPKSQPPYIADGHFAVLDERTIEDGTVLLASYRHWRERIDPDNPSDEDDASNSFEGWRTVRSTKEAAADHLSILPVFDMNQLIAYMKPEDDGVWRDLNSEQGS